MNLRGVLADIFTPVGFQIDIKNAVLTIQDGTGGTPNSITVKIGEGNLTWDENRNVEYILDRGTIDEVRLGDEAPMDVSFDFVWEYITGDTASGGIPPTIEDALKQINNAASWVSTDADACRPYAVDLVLTHNPNCAGNDTETITLPDFRWETLSHDLREGTVSVTGRCNAQTASIVRAP